VIQSPEHVESVKSQDSGRAGPKFLPVESEGLSLESQVHSVADLVKNHLFQTATIQGANVDAGRRRTMQPRIPGPTARRRVARGLGELTGRSSRAQLGLRSSDDRKVSTNISPTSDLGTVSAYRRDRVCRSGPMNFRSADGLTIIDANGKER
jgi:hypothetical protein